MRAVFLVLSVVLSSLLFVSCVNTASQRQGEIDRLTSRQANLGNDFLGQKQKVSSLEEEVSQSLHSQEENLKRIQENFFQLQDRIVRLEKQVNELSHSLGQNSKSSLQLGSRLESTREKIDLILDEVSKENERILKEMKRLHPRGPNFYVVKRGDSISKIARRQGVSIDQIIEANQLDDADQIYVGQKLKIPKK